MEKDPANMVFRLLGFIRASGGIQFLSIAIEYKSVHAFSNCRRYLPAVIRPLDFFHDFLSQTEVIIELAEILIDRV